MRWHNTEATEATAKGSPVIRYRCPHCDKVCESADVMRGFTVYCLGCRQTTRVPDESTVEDDVPPAPRLAPPEPPPIVRVPEPLMVAAPLLAREPEPVAVVSLPVKPPTVVERKPPIGAAASTNRRRLVYLALFGLLAIVLIVAGTFGMKKYRQRQEVRAELQRRQEREKLQDDIREGFGPDALRRIAAKTPKWDLTPQGPVRVKGKLVVLSVTENHDDPRGFWSELFARWPHEIADDASLVRDLLERGKVDDLMFDLPDERWAEGAGEVDTIVGVRWRKEVAGTFNGATLIEFTERHGPPREPLALRWRATVMLLERATGKLIARQELVGPLPKSPPAGDRKFALGMKPYDEVRQWLLKAESGALKAASP